jgi:two-component system nitrogen regulation response regulator GlnG/two-component system response regulator HydG
LHLVLAWSLHEPERLGENVAVHAPMILGRGAPLAEDPMPRAVFERMRPGATETTPPIANARIPRLQLLLEPLGEDALRVSSIGRAAMRVNGSVTTDDLVHAGDVIEIHNAAAFLVTSRVRHMSELRAGEAWAFPFGQSDAFGMVGESEPIWALRDALTFAAATDRHVLLLGESGAGKELAARALHRLSSPKAREFVARNATTMPDTLLDAELFGNARGYPNPGMAERPGLIGQAHGGTLFLDEIGDLPERSQAHLLRVLDKGGEYQRLGDAATRRAEFRLVAATNRPLDTLKHDFLARFTHRIVVPGLSERRDDLPLVLAELLQRIARQHPQLAQRFFERRNNLLAEPRLEPAFVVRLLRHQFTQHVRELERLVWLALGSADADYIGVTEAVAAELKEIPPAPADAAEIDRDALVAAIAEYGRSPTRLAKQLGLKNRYVLIRLLKKHGLTVDADDDTGTP